ncbi:unnamed protein product [Chrysodeixis includens]|uniref:Cilia- and flagella-associated protein 263 n=1 Tax=Chrysodeixis includens TaxID=689277 RepID=A0A9P0FYQ7_CHRIL|nr:unnamed protein product [Chrysodeixis includens]
MSGGTGQSEMHISPHPPAHQPQHRVSYVSQSTTSHSYSQSGAELDVIKDEELVALVNKLKSEVRLMKVENEILENTIKRLDPSLMHGVYQALEYATRMNIASYLRAGSFVKTHSSKVALIESLLASPSRTITSPSRLTASPSRASTRKIESSAKLGGSVLFGAGPRINILEKSELVSTEMELLMSNLEKSRRKATQQHALLKAQLEEVGTRVTDIENSTKSFKQEVIVEGWDKIAQRIPAEIWIKFLRDSMKLSDSQVGKLRLRTSTLNTQYSKLKGQIKVKAELSESLRPVDFEKLMIENSEALKSIDQKLSQLTELKQMTGEANLNLTVHKKAMMEQNWYLNEVLRTTQDRKNQTVGLNRERGLIKVQADLLAQKLNEVRKVRQRYKVPDVMDYVKVKSDVTDLKHGIKLLENRVHIQQIALSTVNKSHQKDEEKPPPPKIFKKREKIPFIPSGERDEL